MDAAALGVLHVAAEGVGVRVVSLPSWELFAKQGAAYRAEVLPPDVPKLAIEAATPFGWERWVGNDPARGAVDWRRLDIWWGDERFVAPDDPERNAGQARASFLDAVGVDPANVHEVPASDEVATAEENPDVVREVRDHFGEKVVRAVVPRSVRLSEAPSFGQPIIAFDPSSRGAIAYRELAKEVSGGTPQRTR